MIAITASRPIHWWNRYSDHPVLAVAIGVPTAFAWRPASIGKRIAGIIDEAFPSVLAYDEAETVFEFVARLALGIQRSYDAVPQIAGARRPGAGREATIFFACRDPYLAGVAARCAVSLTNRLAAPGGCGEDDVSGAIDRIRRDCHAASIGQTALAIARAATTRGIPWFRISPHYRDIQLGHGHTRGRFRESMASRQSHFGAVYANNKDLTCRLLQSVRLPAGRFATVQSVEAAARAAETIGFPVVLKPVHGLKGEDVAIGLRSADEVRIAAAGVATRNWPVLVQSFFPGDDHRLLVVAGRFVAGARRVPASVVGDGTHTVAALIDGANRDPRRGDGFSRLMNRITIDQEVRRILCDQGLDLDAVPGEGRVVALRRTANISTGGTAVDVTETIHPDNVRLAERAARTLGLDIAGVDLICPDITRSWKEVGGGICEVNCFPGLRPHWVANPARDVVTPILETLYPPGAEVRIPTAVIAGGPGDGAAARILARILARAGHVVGTATASGIEIGGERIWHGNAADAQGAAVVMADPTVTAAVLEVTLEEVRERGLYVERCDAIAVFGTGSDADGIGSERRIFAAARGVVVVDADDRRCRELAAELAPERTVVFSVFPASPAVETHCAQGGAGVLVRTSGDGGGFGLRLGMSVHPIVGVADRLAAAMGAGANLVAETLAAVGLAHGLGIPASTIAAALGGSNRQEK